MYTEVALDPGGSFHFEVGRALAESLGYPADALDRAPAGAVASFAGVGHFFDLAALRPGDRVLDLGSGSGMDAFVAGAVVGPAGTVVGVDYTEAQLTKARKLAAEAGLGHVLFAYGDIADPPVPDGAFDCVMSNGVINLAPDKPQVFAAAARALVPGGRLAIADIVTERHLTEAIVCNADLWASCIGGAAQHDDYERMIADAGLAVQIVRENPYRFVSDRARRASDKYGVRSVSLLARKPV
ncbi:MAG: methyltransferase domain-containing protein [Hamadaea sp.]|nr:methyltransferase domain-containing protein [Hamadaea sp.]